MSLKSRIIAVARWFLKDVSIRSRNSLQIQFDAKSATRVLDVPRARMPVANGSLCRLSLITGLSLHRDDLFSPAQ